MWRYWELLTDESMDSIGMMKLEGDARAAKEKLIRRIIADFHGDAAAENPLEHMDAVAVVDPRLNRVLVQAGLAPSVTRADEMIKSGAISLDPAVSPLAPTAKLPPGKYTIRAGKKLKRVTV